MFQHVILSRTTPWLEQLETMPAKNRRDTAGLPVVFKSVAGDFVEQMAAMDERVKALEGTRA